MEEKNFFERFEKKNINKKKYPSKKYKQEKKKLMHEICQQVDEQIPYDDFSSQIRHLNNEQQIIVDDILY
jgi:hypothetical protein